MRWRTREDNRGEDLTERLCAPMSTTILQSFKYVGHVITEKVEKPELLTDGWTDGQISDQFYKVISVRWPKRLDVPVGFVSNFRPQRLKRLCPSPLVRSPNIGQVPSSKPSTNPGRPNTDTSLPGGNKSFWSQEKIRMIFQEKLRTENLRKPISVKKSVLFAWILFSRSQWTLDNSKKWGPEKMFFELDDVFCMGKRRGSL